MTLQKWIYLGVALFLWRFFSGAWLRSEGGDRQSLFDAVFMGAVGAAIWPVVLAFWLIYRACMRWPDAARRLVLHEPSRARLERRRARRQAEVDRLEQELEL